MNVLVEGLTWGEGPRVHDGALWVSDTQGSRLWTNDGGSWTQHPLASPSNGLWFLPDGTLVGAMMMEQRIGAWTGESFAPLTDLSHVARGRLGDMTGDPYGGLYIDDLGPAPSDGSTPLDGRILRVGPDGQVDVAAVDVQFPNGLALVEDNRTLVVAQTFAQNLVAFEVGSGGTLGRRRPYADLRALVGENARPDGIWATSDGIWVATLEGRVVVKVRDSQIVDSIELDGFPIACCEDDAGRLYVTVAQTDGRAVFEALAAKAVRTRVVVAREAHEF